MRHRALFIFSLVLALLATACNLSGGGSNDTDDPVITLEPVGRPTVTINSPEEGDEYVVDEDVLVSATANDEAGVTRVQLIADGQIVKTVSSESPTGDTTLPVLLDYRPREEGTVTLEVIAYRNAVASDPAIVEIEVRETEVEVVATRDTSSAPNVPVIDPNDPTCRALINVNLRLRTGPGTEYDIIRVLGAGAVIPIIGRIGSNQWWQLNTTNGIGWVSANFTTIYGNCSGIPVVIPPPTPTGTAPTPTPTPTNTPVPTNTPLPTNTPGPADLVISDISGNVAPDLQGESSVTEEYGIQITNTGNDNTGQFSNVVIVVESDEEIDFGVVSNLAPGESVFLQNDITFSSTGTFTLQVRADADGDVTEVSKVNNIAVYPVTVTDSGTP